MDPSSYRTVTLWSCYTSKEVLVESKVLESSREGCARGCVQDQLGVRSQRGRVIRSKSSNHVGEQVSLCNRLGPGGGRSTWTGCLSPGRELGGACLPKTILLNQGKASSSPCLSFLQLAPPVSPQIWHSWSSFRSSPPDSSIRTSSCCKLGVGG